MTNEDYQERYRNRHRQEIKIRRRKWILDNFEHYKRYRKEYYIKNKKIKKKYDKIYKDINKEKILAMEKERYKKNRTQIISRMKNYAKNNKKNRNKYLTERKKIDPLFKLVTTVRSRLGIFLKKKNLTKKHKFVEYIGCTPEKLKKHIENQFKDDMTWSNHSLHGWHIDHIIPLDSAKNEKEVYNLCHYKNLQPLWSWDNFSKNNKLICQTNK
jgi:hypothetical protein